MYELCQALKIPSNMKSQSNKVSLLKLTQKTNKLKLKCKLCLAHPKQESSTIFPKGKKMHAYLVLADFLQSFAKIRVLAEGKKMHAHLVHADCLQSFVKIRVLAGT